MFYVRFFPKLLKNSFRAVDVGVVMELAQEFGVLTVGKLSFDELLMCVLFWFFCFDMPFLHEPSILFSEVYAPVLSCPLQVLFVLSQVFSYTMLSLFLA